MKILVAIETRNGRIQPASRELLTAARSLAGPDGEVLALVPAADPAAVSRDLGAANRILAATNAAFDRITSEAYGSLLAAATEAEKPDAVLCAYTALGLDLAPSLAARTGLPLVAYCTALSGSDHLIQATSQIYGGKFVATTQVTLPGIFMINPGTHAEAPAEPLGTDALAPFEVPADALAGRVRLLEEIAPDESLVDLTKAERIVCVGRGIGDQDSIALAEELASLLGAEIAGSRPVVDSGWLPKERQVGKSGRKVRPKLYLALGVSGAPEHIEGMGRSDLIVAVNQDKDAPIFEVAHYAATCDLLDLIPALTERLQGEGL